MWKQISNEAYHGEYRSYLSSSDIRRLLRSPAHYRAPSTPPSEAQEFGTLVHEAILEPDLWAARCRPSGKIDRRTKEGKAIAEWQESQSESLGLRFIPEYTYNKVCAIAERVQASVGASGLLTSGVAESSGFSEIYGQPVKIRPDYMTDEVIVDLKTTNDAREFEKSVFNYGYDIQAAFYVAVAEAIDGIKRKFVWLVVEKETPHGVQIYEPSPEVMERGTALFRQAIDTYKTCATLDVWPSYSTKTQTVNLPRWIK